MSKNIDYEAYLKQLGEVTTNQIEAIKKYLEEQIKNDNALAALYRPEKINDCYSFIYEAVSKMKRDGKCAVVEEAVVYKMARDYFIEILPGISEEAPEVKPEENAVDVTPVQEAVKEVSEQIEEDAAEDEEEHGKCELEVIGEDNESEESEPCHQEENVVEKDAAIRYDENGEALLFDFM